ncbi:hypothetical protein GF336_00570 [Candidatus Woesearchaeota archaeon]|nr:hypothetical protein [Candidatus Woesearchaeota archaeon]
MNKRLILIFLMGILIMNIAYADISAQIKRTNPGIAQVKPAELIYDIVNTDMNHKIEGFILCKSPDDIKISSTMGFASGSGSQYVSPIFVMDEGPSQRAVYFTIESDYEGDYSTDCTFKYVPYKEVNGEKIYQKMNLQYTTERTDDIFSEIRLDKTVPFVASDVEGDVYCKGTHCSKDNVIIKKALQTSTAVFWIIIGLLVISALILAIILMKKKITTEKEMHKSIGEQKQAAIEEEKTRNEQEKEIKKASKKQKSDNNYIG